MFCNNGPCASSQRVDIGHGREFKMRFHDVRRIRSVLVLGMTVLACQAVAVAASGALEEAITRATEAGANATTLRQIVQRAESRKFGEADQLAIVERIRAAAASGLPADLIAEKALEGLAKGVPAPRLDAALGQIGERLAAASVAVEQAKLPTSDSRARAELVRAAAAAMRGGAAADQVTAVASKGKSEKRAAIALDVLAGLTEAGVPVEKAHAVVTRSFARKLSDSQLAGLDRSTVTIAGLTGLAAADAALAAVDGLSRGLTPRQIADEHRGIRDGLTGRGGIGGTPAGSTNPSDGTTSGTAPGSVPGADSGGAYIPPGSESGFGTEPGGGYTTPFPTATPYPSATPFPTTSAAPTATATPW